MSRSTWACELKFYDQRTAIGRIASRSTWACELKLLRSSWRFGGWQCHAPRERVSWNKYCKKRKTVVFVTLHVSVWVEILLMCRANRFNAVTLHVSVWVEISLPTGASCSTRVTLHVSVWVEIFHAIQRLQQSKVTLHVSVWVEIAVNFIYCAFWIVTLHVSVWVEIVEFSDPALIKKSRSTWACELKWQGESWDRRWGRHAPRERVSWNV